MPGLGAAAVVSTTSAPGINVDRAGRSAQQECWAASVAVVSVGGQWCHPRQFWRAQAVGVSRVAASGVVVVATGMVMPGVVVVPLVLRGVGRGGGRLG
jgi:hypothetical protein